MIQQDRISRVLTVLAVLIFVFLFTFENSAVVIFPIVLLTVGIVMHRFVSGRAQKGEEFDDSEIENPRLLKETIYYTVLALFGVFLCSYAIKLLPLAIKMGLTGASATLYDILIAIAEEQFFRGFITDWLLTSLPNPYVAIFISGGIFMVYHLAHYGTALGSMLYVAAGGFILSWTAYRSKHITPCVLGHVINNASAYLTNVKMGIGTAITLISKVS